MSALEELTPRKGQQTAAALIETDDRALLAKKQKARSSREIRSCHRSPSFWDTLSKLRLSRGALREFDRRNDQIIHSPVFISDSTIVLPDPQKLKQLARRGGPDLVYLRGCPVMAPLMPGGSSKSTSQNQKQFSHLVATKTLSRSSPYSGNFGQKLVDLGVYPERYKFQSGQMSPSPANLEAIKQRLIRHRPSLSSLQFSESSFDDFMEKCATAVTEARSVMKILPEILGQTDDQHFSESGVEFTHLEKFDKGLTFPKPDLYYEPKPDQIDERIRDELGQYIVPSSNTSFPAAPNYFVETKGKSGNIDVGERQIRYYLAAGTRGMQSLQNYGAREVKYDNNAYTFGCLYHNGNIRIYVTHPARPVTTRGTPRYYMTLVAGFDIAISVKHFREGVGAFRNARDFAKELRDQFIDKANGLAHQISRESPVEETELIDLDESSDELA